MMLATIIQCVELGGKSGKPRRRGTVVPRPWQKSPSTVNSNTSHTACTEAQVSKG